LLASSARSDYEIEQMVKADLLIKIKEQMRDLIQQGKAEGVVHQKFDTDTILQYIEMFRGWYDTGLEQAANEKKAKDLFDLFIYGIRGSNL
jgi:hypothetical protein